MTFQFLIMLAYAVLCMAGFIWISKNKVQPRKPLMVLLAVLMLGGLIRLYYGVQLVAYWHDIRCFKEWGDAIALFGMKNVYNSGIFLDYPPGYMYILWLSNLVQDFLQLNLNGRRYTLIIKAPAMAADLISAMFIYYVASKKLDEKTGLFLASAYTFCPAIIYNSAIWGQIDSWYTLFVLLALYFATEDNVVMASISYAVALITKPQALLFGPVLLFWVIRKKDWKVFFTAVGTGLSVVYLMALPFSSSLNPLWLVKLYANTFGGYKYFTVNGYNLFMLSGLNYVEILKGQRANFINPAVIVLCFVFCMWAYFTRHTKGINFSTAATLITVFFSFCTMMHERYMHPAIILAVFTYIYTQHKGWLLTALLSVGANYLNVASVLREYYLDVAITQPMYSCISIMAIAAALTAVVISAKGKNDHVIIRK